MFRRILAALIGSALFAIACAAGFAQSSPNGSNNVEESFTLTSASSSYPMALSGQATCAVTVTALSGSVTLVPQVASDGPTNPQTWVTASQINSGSINAVGTYVGSIAAQGLTNFRVTATAISGSVSGVLACSPATASVGTSGGGGGGGGGSTATLYTPAPTGVGATPAAPAISYNLGYNANTGLYDMQRLNPDHVLQTTGASTHRFVLPSGTGGGACVNLASGYGHIIRLWNAGAATTAYVQLYDESTNTCAAADAIWGDGTTLVVPAGGFLTFDGALTQGLTYKITGTLTANLSITTSGLGY